MKIALFYIDKFVKDCDPVSFPYLVIHACFGISDLSTWISKVI